MLYCFSIKMRYFWLNKVLNKTKIWGAETHELENNIVFQWALHFIDKFHQKSNLTYEINNNFNNKLYKLQK